MKGKIAAVDDAIAKASKAVVKTDWKIIQEVDFSDFFEQKKKYLRF